ncbi:MAG: winged helix-turn-helix transcriptional regulator [Chthonomonadales bacterium]
MVRPSRNAVQPSVATMMEEIVGCKWSLRLLDLICEGQCRPSAMLRACPGLSAKVMNQRLAKMIRYGILTRTVYGEKPPVRVTYTLTNFGQRFTEILNRMRELQEAYCAQYGAPSDVSAPADGPHTG